MKRYRTTAILLVALALIVAAILYMRALPSDADVSASGDGEIDAAAPSDVVSIVDKPSDTINKLTISGMNGDLVMTRSVSYSMPTASPTENADGADTDGSDTEGAVESHEPTPEPTPIKEITWSAVGMEGERLLASKMSAAASAFCGLQTVRLILSEHDQANDESRENSANRAYDVDSAGVFGDALQYGFDDSGEGPTAETVVKGEFDDGLAVSLEIGDMNPSKDGYYARSGGAGSDIYLVSASSVESIVLSPTDILDPVLMEISRESVAGIELSRGGELVFSARKVGDGMSFDVTSPVLAELSEDTASLIFDSIESMSGEEYVYLNPSDTIVEECGLESPRYELAVSLAGGETRTLLIGQDAVSGQTAYAMIQGTAGIGTLRLSNLGFLDRPLRECIDRGVCPFERGDVSSVFATFDAEEVTAKINEDESSSSGYKYIVNGVDVSSLSDESGANYFETFFESIANVGVYDVELVARPSGEAEISFLFTPTDGRTDMLVEFVPKDDRLYYVVRDGVYTGVTAERNAFDSENGLRGAYARLAQAAGL